MATVTVSVVEEYVVGDRMEVVADVTITGTYTVNGDRPSAGYAAELGLDAGLSSLMLHGPARVTGGMVGASYDATNDKILLYGNSDATAAINEKSPELTGVAIPGGPAVVRVTAKGKGPGSF